MASTVYVNVNGTWKQATDYYVNVNGTWKTGQAIQANVQGSWSTHQPSGPVSLPTWLETATLDFPEFGCKPVYMAASKQGINSEGLDLPIFGCKPFYCISSDFVYQPPSGGGGGSTPTNVLPKYDTSNLTLDDFLEFGVIPYIFTGVNAPISLISLDVPEFQCKPKAGNDNSYTYVPPSQQYGAVLSLGDYSTTAGGVFPMHGIAYKLNGVVTTENIGSQAGYGVNVGTGQGLSLQVASTNSSHYDALTTVNILNGGSGYQVGDTIKIWHTFRNGIMNWTQGNSYNANSTRAAVAGNTYGVTVTNAMTSGGGYGAYFDIEVQTDGSVVMDIASNPNDWDLIGNNFTSGEIVTIPDSLVGNTGAPDLQFAVAGLIDDGFRASRTVTSVSSAPTPPANILPNASAVTGLDLPIFGCLPQVTASAKTGIDSGTLDFPIFGSAPLFTQNV